MDENQIQEVTDTILKSVQEAMEGNPTSEQFAAVEKSLEDFQKAASDFVPKSEIEEIARKQAADLVSAEVEKFIEAKDVVEQPTVGWEKSLVGNKTQWHCNTDIDTLYKKHGYSLSIEKAVAQVQDVDGAGTRTGSVWTPKTGGNPWYPLVDVVDVGTNGAFNVTSFGQVAFQNRETTSGADKSLNALTNAGTIGNDRRVVEDWEIKIPVSLPVLNDVPDFANKVELAIVRADSLRKGTDCFNVMKAGAVNKVASKTAAEIPAAADIMSAVGTDYMDDGVLVLSRPYWARLKTAMIAAGSGGVMERTFNDYRVVTSDRMEPGDAANQVSAAFGDWMSAILLAERKDLMIESNPYTELGNMTWYACSRFKNAVADTGSYAVVESRAS